MNKFQKEAIAFLEVRHLSLLLGNLKQAEMNGLSDRLRIYLGPDSRVYDAFYKIDLNNKDVPLLDKCADAGLLLQEAIDTITLHGLYFDTAKELAKMQIKESKNKNRTLLLVAVIGSFIGFLLTDAKDIGKFVLKVLHKCPQ